MTHTPSQMPEKFTKKPVTIEAIRWTGDNLKAVIDFIGLHPSAEKWTWDEYAEVVKKDGLKIFTLEGTMMANVGDWIIKGVKGEFYPCKPDIFEATYTRAASVPSEPYKMPSAYKEVPTFTTDNTATKSNPFSVPSDRERHCVRCGEKATHELRPPNVTDEWSDYCESCMRQEYETCQEVADHEMRHFGGEYGIPTLESRKIISIPDQSEVIDALKEMLGGLLHETAQRACDCKPEDAPAWFKSAYARHFQALALAEKARGA